MKKVLSIVFVLAILTSCVHGRMQVVSLSCDKLTQSDSVWYYRDSLVDIEYYYYSKGGHINFEIVNKTDKPLFIDGKNSMLIANNAQKSYWMDKEQINANLSFYPNTYFRNNNPINGVITKADRITMIPPHASIVVKKFNVCNGTLYNISQYSCIIDTVPINWKNKPGKKTTITKAHFQKSNTPLSFRNFVSLSKTEDFKEPIYYDFPFYISDIWDMDARQATMSNQPVYFSSGSYANFGKDKTDIHPFKEAWKFYLTNIKPIQ